jgi:hypothetical protein
MRPTSRIRLPLAVLGLACAGLTSACGPSELERSYHAYVDEVEPLLEEEGKSWDRIVALIKKRAEDAAMPRYYKYVRETALPYYTEFHAVVTALEPGGERIGKAHESLLQFADARLEFLHLEDRGHDVYTRATADGGLLKIQSQVQEAEALRIAYLRAVGDGAPDAKFGELYQIIDPFTQRYFQPMQQQLKDPAEVQVRLRSHVVPALEILYKRKYHDDAPGRLLKECVRSWLDWHKLLEAKCPLLQDVMQAKQKSEAAAQAAEEALTKFREELSRIRLEL